MFQEAGLAIPFVSPLRTDEQWENNKNTFCQNWFSLSLPYLLSSSVFSLNIQTILSTSFGVWSFRLLSRFLLQLKVVVCFQDLVFGEKIQDPLAIREFASFSRWEPLLVLTQQPIWGKIGSLLFRDFFLSKRKLSIIN